MRHELTKFLALVEYKSFTLASRRLNVSQPALSMAIKSLENELSTALISRDTRHFELTEAGKIVYESAIRVRNEIDTMDQLLTESSQTMSSKLRIGMIDSIAERLFEAGNISNWEGLTVRVDNSARLIRDVEMDRLDIACIVAQPDQASKRITHNQIGAEKFVLVCHPGQAAQAKRQLTAGRIDNWLSYNMDSSTYRILSHALDEDGVKAKPIFFSTSPSVLRQMALQNQGVALLPLHTVADALTAKKLTQLSSKFYKRSIWFITHTQKFRGVQISNFIDQIRNLLAS